MVSGLCTSFVFFYCCSLVILVVGSKVVLFPVHIPAYLTAG